MRAARNFSLVSHIVAAAIDKGIYRPHEPREVVDLLWSLFLGLVHLSETRKNLGVTIATLRDPPPEGVCLARRVAPRPIAPAC